MASFFVWDPQRYGLQIPEMDAEHKQLIEYMNQIFESHNEKASKTHLLSLINELIDFVLIHFKNEESYLEKIKFPGLVNHKNIHQRLLSQLRQYKANYEADPAATLNDKFFEFLTLWLSSHIQHFDKQYSSKKKIQ